MNPLAPTASPLPPLNSRWRLVPPLLAGLGGLLALYGALTNPAQFGYSYLQAFMFYFSICLGCLFMVMLHHLFDANWSVPIRRVAEHLAFLLPVMAVLFIPIALLAPSIYPWVRANPQVEESLHSKQPLLSLPWFYGTAVVLFALLAWLAYCLRKWSLEQDKTGEAKCTFKMRRHSAYGIFVFSFALTLAAIMGMKAVDYQWFSTIYGVYYFAGSAWAAVATLYVLTVVLSRFGPLSGVAGRRQLHDLGMLLLTFTIFYAYIGFSQYFLIWNAALPEETFFFVKREAGSWWNVGLLIIFGHFALPFLALLRIDAKLWLPLMIPLCAWCWLMQFFDMSFNIMPVLHPEGFVLHYLDLACLLFIGGVLAWIFITFLRRHAPYPVKDPRLAEALGVHGSGLQHSRPPGGQGNT